jgi:hypothetical protein
MLAHLRRIGSLTLLLALVGGGLGLPLFDAVVFHAPGRKAPPERALGTEGALAGHASVCILGRVAPQSRGLPSLPPASTLSTTDQLPVPPAPATLPAAESHLSLQQSRAPPALPA